LFARLGIEVTPILVIPSERVVPTGGSLERIPPNKNDARTFVSVEVRQKTRKFDDSPPPPGSPPPPTLLKTRSAASPSENGLFASSHSGGERAAPMYSIRQAAKLNAQEGYPPQFPPRSPRLIAHNPAGHWPGGSRRTFWGWQPKQFVTSLDPKLT
jgi:hypothetical protein